MLSRVEAKGHEWMRTTNFFFVVYTGISWKMERWLMEFMENGEMEVHVYEEFMSTNQGW